MTVCKVGLCMQDYKSLCAAVTTCATLVRLVPPWLIEDWIFIF